VSLEFFWYLRICSTGEVRSAHTRTRGCAYCQAECPTKHTESYEIWSASLREYRVQCVTEGVPACNALVSVAYSMWRRAERTHYSVESA
jgi:hypothetical protein